MSGVSRKFVIGQVLFIFFGDEYKLVPVQISEENTVRSMQGERTTYKVLVGEGRIIGLEELLAKPENKVFESADDARKVILASATSTIDKIVASATASSRQWYPNQVSRSALPKPAVPTQTIPFDVSDIVGPKEEATPLVKQPARAGEYDGPVIEHEDGSISRIKFGTPTG